MLITILHYFMQLCDLITYREDTEIRKKSRRIKNIIKGRVYESSRTVNKGWRFTARTKSVSSFRSGAIFQPSSCQDLSRNTFVVSAYAFYKNLYWRIGPGNDLDSWKFSKKCSLRASCSISAALPGAHPSGFRPQLFVRNANCLHDS